MIHHIFKIYIFAAMIFIVLSACGGSVTTVGNPKGATVNVSITNDIDAPAAELQKFVIISSGQYTPDMYILGIRYLGIIRCLDANSSDIECPGQTGEEVNEQLNQGESFHVATLNSIVSDRIIYQASSVSSPAIGNSGTIATNSVTDAGLYSGAQFGLDFVITQFPIDNANVSIGSNIDGNIFAMYCINANGCSSLTGYDSNYDGLSSGDVQSSDIVFLDTASGLWYFWNAVAETFSPISLGRPTIPLTQGSVTGHPTGSDGEIQYNPSFGDLDSLNITQALIDSQASDDMTAVFSVQNTMSFNDSNGDDIIDPSELRSLEFGKFQIDDFELDSGTFN